MKLARTHLACALQRFQQTGAQHASVSLAGAGAYHSGHRIAGGAQRSTRRFRVYPARWSSPQITW